MFDTHKSKFLKTRHEYSKRKVLKYEGSLKAHKHNSPALHGCNIFARVGSNSHALKNDLLEEFSVQLKII